MQRQTKSWTESLKALAIRGLGESNGLSLWHKYAELFSGDYRTLIPPRHALQDMLQLEQIALADRQCISLLKPTSLQPDYRLHFYCRQPRYLDEFIPVLENLNLRIMDQVQFTLLVNGVNLTIKSFSVKPASAAADSLQRFKQSLLATISQVMSGQLENDALNKLVLLTGMHWQDCDLLRTYRNYFLQLDHRTSKASIHSALINNPRVAEGLFAYFEARFRPNPEWHDPLFREEQALFALRLQLLTDMAAVQSLHHDRILRTLFNLIDATVRSNFHQRRDQEDYFVAIKIDSLGVIEMPAPRPLYEIYVHAHDMEGIHLRGGKVSRGGIRWSDRIDDFRTEILDLMQTQISKNALIIPTGAKGGFVVKPGTSQQDFKQAGKNAYIRLIRGLLDLTDNYCGDRVFCPKSMVMHDDPDPYLVVAADKGTAKFSDIANAVAADYQFWLGDAFASGGSHGYDHKALGITARGAWECVKRHFRELGKDIQQQAFTVIGIGSMDGDVFGNAMLLSPQIRLLAAFSGQHIFLDPNPHESDAAFKERQRLFELPGSTWNDYDRALISPGGGVHSRSDKDIAVSPEVRQWLGIRFKTIDGESLIQALLKSAVELLWLGGIGTYVKASSEKHEDVGDRDNDNVRINADELRALVVGEGANLGFTQQARVEYSLRGGRINTDAVDNSAGVDTSDHEVNLKILLSGLQQQQQISDYQRLFIAMTEAVCQSVLADNIAQSLCLSLEQRRCAENPTPFIQVAERLQAAGFLDREVESFPSGKQLQARPEPSLTRPELAVLMAAAKMYLTRQLENAGDWLQSAHYQPYLHAYFPTACREQFAPYLANHPLAQPIKATVISNLIINQAGCGFLARQNQDTADLLTYVACYLTFDQVLRAAAIRSAIQALDNQISADSQYSLLLQLEQSLADLCQSTLAHQNKLCPDPVTISSYQTWLSEFRDQLNQQSGPSLQTQIASYQQLGIPLQPAQDLALIDNLRQFPFLVSLVKATRKDLGLINALLNDINRNLGTWELQCQLAAIPPRDVWVSTICASMQADIQRFTASLLQQILLGGAASCAEYLQHPSKAAAIRRYQNLYQEIQKIVPVNLLAYVLLVKALGDLN